MEAPKRPERPKSTSKVQIYPSNGYPRSRRDYKTSPARENERERESESLDGRIHRSIERSETFKTKPRRKKGGKQESLDRSIGRPSVLLINLLWRGGEFVGRWILYALSLALYIIYSKDIVLPHSLSLSLSGSRCLQLCRSLWFPPRLQSLHPSHHLPASSIEAITDSCVAAREPTLDHDGDGYAGITAGCLCVVHHAADDRNSISLITSRCYCVHVA